MQTKKIQLINLIALSSVSSILTNCGKDMHDKYGLKHWKNSSIKTFLIVIYTALKNSVYGVYDQNGKIVATFSIKRDGEWLHFGKLAVSPRTTGKGIGSYCIDWMLRLASDKGLKGLRCEVYDKSEHAIQFYTNRGFLVVGEKKTVKYNELILEKTLRDNKL